jgi:inosine-uridine nucleoside N-ribohydrolase
MMWVDTDYGFDDLWAILLLGHLDAEITGISLIAGNARLAQVTANALGARKAYGINAPLYAGADRPLRRALETAERILGAGGMCSRGRTLPDPQGDVLAVDAHTALASWLNDAGPDEPREILAIGPLTNVANLVQQSPESAAKITRLIWMGGSAGPGNHSAQAEFNALADPEAASIVAQAGLPLDVVDLMICRQIVFGETDMPETDPLTADLLGGYLDIALSRGRDTMAIYDPVAALAAIRPDLFHFKNCTMHVSTEQDESYGATHFAPDPKANTRLAIGVTTDISEICLNALAKDI